MSRIRNTLVFNTDLNRLKIEVSSLVDARACDDDINRAVNEWADTLDIEEIGNPYDDPS